ncbi:MAG: cupin domain-containing protein [Fibrobacteres bacterium]|nr:cupin domain-containing protein [Fibrobacterota bacterium]
MFVKGSKMNFVDRKKLLARGGKMMMLEYHLTKRAPGEIPKQHSHPHEQNSYLLSGSLKLYLDKEEYLMEKGDSFYVAPDVPHSVAAQDDNTVILDVFTPQREDFLS